jgi:hypothetical protein
MHHRIPHVAGKRIGIIISGGNADPARFAAILNARYVPFSAPM